jgi:3-oxoacyl-[acyl-carrier-protein] synthase-3
MIITGLGSYLPPRVLTNKEIESFIDTTDEWIQEKLGIKERRIADSNISASDLAYNASIIALNDAKIDAKEIDLIIVATSTPDRISPSTACILQQKLNASNAAAFDINAVCSGFIYGLSIANSFLKSNTYKRILLVASEVYSKITNWKDRQCVFFGDGSGAVVLEFDDSNLFDCLLYADGTGKENFTVRAGGSYMPASYQTIDDNNHYFDMNGKAVYETGKKVLPESILTLLNKNNICIEQISYLIPHQPSINILKETAKILNLPFEKVGTSMQVYANTAGASIPVTMDLMYQQNKFKTDDLLIFAAVGSGWTWGSAIIRWKK